MRSVFGWFLSGKTLSEVVKEMAAKYRRSPIWIAKVSGKTYGGVMYSENIVRKMLKNPSYTGNVYLKLGKNEYGNEKYAFL